MEHPYEASRTARLLPATLPSTKRKLAAVLAAWERNEGSCPLSLEQVAGMALDRGAQELFADCVIDTRQS
jgi:hypothetical protein